MNQKREELLTLGMGKLFLRQAVPAILGMVVMGLYNLVDAIFVGRFVGKHAVGATVVVYTVVLVNQAFSTLIGSGAMVRLSRALGQKDEDTVRRIAGSLVLSISCLSIPLVLLGFFIPEPIVRFLGGSGEILRLGGQYLRVLSTGFLFSALAPGLNRLLRGEGRMKEAMIIASIGVALNILLDPIFIRVLGMGVAGAALATVISQGVYLLLNVVYIRFGKSVVTLRWRNLRPAFDLLPSILSVGFSAMFMLIMVAGQQVAVFKILAIHGGNDHISLMGVALRVYMFILVPLSGIGQGLQPVIGINYGAGRYDRVGKAYRYFTGIATWVSIGFWACFMLFPGTILGGFITDAAVVAWGKRYFRIFFSLFGFLGFNITTIILFQSMGKAVFAAVTALLKQAVVFIPMLFLLPFLFGVQGAWMAMPVADGCTLAVSFILLLMIHRELIRDGLESSQTPSLLPFIHNR